MPASIILTGENPWRGALCGEPCVFLSGVRVEDVLPEGRRSGRHCTHVSGCLYDQSYCGGLSAGAVGVLVDCVSRRRVRSVRRNGNDVARAGDVNPAPSGARSRDCVLEQGAYPCGVEAAALGPYMEGDSMNRGGTMFFMNRKKSEMVETEAALPGRSVAIQTAKTHFVNGNALTADVADGFEVAMFGMGCFWGVERMFWKLDGVYLTMVGYAGGFTPNATYQEVCSGQTGHNEVVRIIYDPAIISFEDLLKVFWEGHDPTQGMRQGNDVGTQYRSGIYVFNEAQKAVADATKQMFAERLAIAGFEIVTTEVVSAPEFYFAEDYHQQYLAKNPSGYCGIGGTGVTCPIGTGISA